GVVCGVLKRRPGTWGSLGAVRGRYDPGCGRALMIKRLYVDNYRCLVNFHLKLREMTLLVGSNGSGKSSVLDIMSALRRLLSGGGRVTDPDAFPSRSLTRWQNRRLQVFEIVVSLKGEDDFIYRLEVEHEVGGRKAGINLESLKIEDRPLFEFRRGEVQL